MAFRGHREVDEPPFFAEEEVLDETCTGNFRSIVNLLAKYDAPLSTSGRKRKSLKASVATRKLWNTMSTTKNLLAHRIRNLVA